MGKPQDVTIENQQMKLVISGDGTARSLVCRATGAECLIQGKRIPFSTITEPRPYQNEVKLAYPNKQTTFKSNSVRKDGDRLIIGYELIPWEASVSVKISEDYIAFSLEAFNLTEPYGIAMTEPPISDMWFLRLPVRERGHWGDWLNVIWDDDVAVNVLAAGPYANADSEEGDGYRVLQAGTDADVKLTGVTAALIVCARDELLDKIAVVERDYGLPNGVASRRHELYNASYYSTGNVTPADVDEHIRYAQMGGFRLMKINYSAFLESRGYRLLGNYDDYRKEYPGGKAGLKAMLAKIKKAGITPGCHFLHSHIGRDSRYVTPVPDRRLNLLRIFTLAKPLGKTDTVIHVQQNPQHSAMAEGRRVLKIGTELISYEGFTTAPPYTFYGCGRAIDRTTVNAQPEGFMFGLLDVSEFGANSVYIDQYSDLQDEVADALAGIWEAGFEFIYFDGSEGVNPPFWHHVSAAQYRVYSKLKPEPIFSEGAAKTHFGWHMLTGGNAFDIFPPEKLKDETIRHPLREAPRMRDNFTRLNFGWLGYWLPDENTIGTQPDQLEFVSGKAAAWDCPVSIWADTDKLAQHPRTADNYEVLRRWEEARAKKLLTDEQKEMLRDAGQEFILLLDEKGELEPVPYNRVVNAAGGSREVIVFTFERKKAFYAVYWHISADRRLELPMKPGGLAVLEGMGAEVEDGMEERDDAVIVPVGKRRYLKTDISKRKELMAALENARVLDA